jgi:signal transduction histidine kinase
MNVLVIDDSRSVRTVLRTFLEEAGYAVAEARDGAEALAMGADLAPDCITMDVQMPEMDGFEATARIRATGWGRLVPIIFVTGMDSLADRERGFALGATEFISKKSTASWREVTIAVDKLLKSEGRLEGVSILVAGADELSRLPVVECLRRQGGTIIEAENGAHAIELLRHQGPQLDMVIADWALCDMRADALCAQLRQKEGYRILPFIALIEAGDRPDVLGFFAGGGTDYVVKPFVKEEFIARVGVHLETRALIRELRHNVDQLESLSRIRDSFIAIASHDLKSPLSGILNGAELILQDHGLAVRDEHLLRSMVGAAKSMLEIINDIVELARSEERKESLAKDLLPVIPCVKVAVSTLHQQALNKGVLVEAHYLQDRDPVIRGDRNRFLRILNNLLSNALKFTPQGGTIQLTVDKRDNDLLITVADSGIGIPEAMLPRLFERYSKSSRPGTNGERGTGLGMSITKQLVDQHNGAITVESVEGRGTVVSLTFPLVPLS